jgi:uncharacterized protein (DUF433 family)
MREQREFRRDDWCAPLRCGGPPCIDNTGIAVADVVALLEAGKTPEEMRVAYPSLSLAQIHAAISYYYDRPDEIEATFAEDDAAEAEHERRRADYLARRTPE